MPTVKLNHLNLNKVLLEEVAGVVGTLMSNFGLELALQELGVEFVRAKVGDRYVMSELLTRQWQFGGESSGHLICLDSTTTGDGIITALHVLKLLLAHHGVDAGAEMRRHLANLADPASRSAHGHRHVFGSDHEDRDDHNDQEFSGADVEHILLSGGPGG